MVELGAAAAVATRSGAKRRTTPHSLPLPARVTEQHVQEQVQDYHGTQLRGSQALKTKACCTEDMPVVHEKMLTTLESEVLEKYYGCGACIPAGIEGCTVLDLGPGSGPDAFLLLKLVGAQGHVVGVDMTDEQLATARRHEQLSSQGRTRFLVCTLLVKRLLNALVLPF